MDGSPAAWCDLDVRLPDKATSRAVLIGTGKYDSEALPDIGAVGNCLTDLGVLLSEGSFAPEHCTVVNDGASPSAISGVLRENAAAAEDVLFVYFVGHAVVDRGGLHFALPHSSPQDMSQGWLAAQPVRRVLEASPARYKILILDCDFYDRAPEGGTLRRTTGIPGDLLRPLAAGYFLLAGGGNVSTPPGPGYTLFTGELIRTLTMGVSGGPELLDLDTIHKHLRSSLRALGRPAPAAFSQLEQSATKIALARNAAFDAFAAFDSSGSSSQAAEPEGESTPGERTAEPDERPPEEEVELTTDVAATLDLLERGPVATVIAMRLVEARRNAQDQSFFTHIDGSWGSGKSTMLNLLRDRLAEDFDIVEFDAWQQSRLGPPWWSLLTATRRRVLRGRPWLRVRETASRMRRTGAPFALALVLVLAVAAAVAYALWPQQPSLRNWSENVKAFIAIVAAVGTLVTSALVASRFLLFDSVRGARLFEQTQTNPIREITEHFRWLLRHSEKPVAFFVDDLDRCRPSYVVDFLDTAQTLIRDTARKRAAYFVVAADGAWLRRSYEKAHSDFAESLERPGRPVGYLFLDKLFQLTIPMPVLTGPAQALYLDAILRIDRPHLEQVSESGSSGESAWGQGDPGGLQARLRAFAEGRAEQVAQVSQTPEERRRTEHVLRRFSHLLGNNPRSVKRFLNTYSILHSIRRLEGNLIRPESLALWTILVVRWPAIAAHLQDDPDAVRGVVQPVWVKEHFPEALLELARSPELCDVITCEMGGPLTPVLIRQCVGLSLGGG
ncbi:hypothetical protein J4573_28970 [Actinomadura barringtoniae]|uniref:KAP NTPase domain-containing protein n=1 Tax=Actinomadura barringtoniae TaxID=1427535 RepID=A0A939PFA7_9ACTN|nr:P-loop NTPase fold protein [Actinomadura barringtoniae]MBO2451157.1 hypothetical protein [Actinomadura barringtoniae]